MATVTAHDEIIHAISHINTLHLKYKFDIIIISRGGGSATSIDTFNHFDICKAIYNSNIPLVTAIGHQIDFTLADLVACKQYGTPSICANEIIISKKIYEKKIYTYKQILHNHIKNYKNIIKKYTKIINDVQPNQLIKKKTIEYKHI